MGVWSLFHVCRCRVNIFRFVGISCFGAFVCVVCFASGGQGFPYMRSFQIQRISGVRMFELVGVSAFCVVLITMDSGTGGCSHVLGFLGILVPLGFWVFVNFGPLRISSLAVKGFLDCFGDI